MHLKRCVVTIASSSSRSAAEEKVFLVSDHRAPAAAAAAGGQYGRKILYGGECLVTATQRIIILGLPLRMVVAVGSCLSSPTRQRLIVGVCGVELRLVVERSFWVAARRGGNYKLKPLARRSVSFVRTLDEAPSRPPTGIFSSCSWLDHQVDLQ